MLLLPSADRTADQSLLIVVMSDEVMFDEVTAAARALYAVVRSVVSWVVGELVYRASNWLSSVESPASVVPEAKAVTRLFSNESRADWLLGVSPSLVSVSKAERIAASSPTVVPEACSIVRTSLCSVARALESEVLETTSCWNCSSCCRSTCSSRRPWWPSMPVVARRARRRGMP